jgi:hypothetical protein
MECWAGGLTAAAASSDSHPWALTVMCVLCVSCV